jgi:hypothetical protein
MAGTRFTKAATPPPGGALNLNRVIGANPRKQKLTEAAGTNPTKLGGGPSVGDVGDRRYAQDTAPHKSLKNEFSFDVGGPGLDQFKPKGFPK